MEKVLVIVDMQNDFIDGSLANKDAQNIVSGICNLIKGWDGDIICTRDTHYANYLNTSEGQKLPVEHCIKDSAGWCVNDNILKALRGKEYCYLNKSTFGSLEWKDFDLRLAEIVLVGTCTDICVIANALLLKTFYPDADIKVISSLCAGVTKEKHEAALETMRSCQINVMENYDGELRVVEEE